MTGVGAFHFHFHFHFNFHFLFHFLFHFHFHRERRVRTSRVLCHVEGMRPPSLSFTCTTLTLVKAVSSRSHVCWCEIYNKSVRNAKKTEIHRGVSESPSPPRHRKESPPTRKESWNIAAGLVAPSRTKQTPTPQQQQQQQHHHQHHHQTSATPRDTPSSSPDPQSNIECGMKQ